MLRKKKQKIFTLSIMKCLAHTNAAYPAEVEKRLLSRLRSKKQITQLYSLPPPPFFFKEARIRCLISVEFTLIYKEIFKVRFHQNISLSFALCILYKTQILREHCKKMAGSHPRNHCLIYPFCNSGEKDTIHYCRLGDRKEQIIVDSAFAARTPEMLFTQQECSS